MLCANSVFTFVFCIFYEINEALFFSLRCFSCNIYQIWSTVFVQTDWKYFLPKSNFGSELASLQTIHKTISYSSFQNLFISEQIWFIGWKITVCVISICEQIYLEHLLQRLLHSYNKTTVFQTICLQFEFPKFRFVSLCNK